MKTLIATTIIALASSVAAAGDLENLYAEGNYSFLNEATSSIDGNRIGSVSSSEELFVEGNYSFLHEVIANDQDERIGRVENPEILYMEGNYSFPQEELKGHELRGHNT